MSFMPVNCFQKRRPGGVALRRHQIQQALARVFPFPDHQIAQKSLVGFQVVGRQPVDDRPTPDGRHQGAGGRRQEAALGQIDHPVEPAFLAKAEKDRLDGMKRNPKANLAIAFAEPGSPEYRDEEDRIEKYSRGEIAVGRFDLAKVLRLPQITRVAVYAVPDEHVGDAVMGLELSHGGHLTHGHPLKRILDEMRGQSEQDHALVSKAFPYLGNKRCKTQL
jgi:hypothetical protein